MDGKFEKKKAKDGKMRLTKVLSVVASDFVPYCLRHTFCTDLQKKGMPINVAKYLMGHSDISVTANIYTHITDAANKISEHNKMNNGNNDGMSKTVPSGKFPS